MAMISAATVSVAANSTPGIYRTRSPFLAVAAFADAAAAAQQQKQQEMLLNGEERHR